VSIRSTIIAQITDVAEQQERHLRPLADDLPLLDSGLDSLCMAILVAKLDDTLGLDPFSTENFDAFPRTVGDFIRVYENAAT
jgi:aryl carrier-like protein